MGRGLLNQHPLPIWGHQKGSKRIERLQPIEEVVKAVDALFRSTPVEVGELRSQPGPGASVKLQTAYGLCECGGIYNCEILSRKTLNNSNHCLELTSVHVLCYIEQQLQLLSVLNWLQPCLSSLRQQLDPEVAVPRLDLRRKTNVRRNPHSHIYRLWWYAVKHFVHIYKYSIN